MKAFSLALLSAIVAESAAQKTATPWGQCGGENWTGALYCSAGQTCFYINYWYSQCQPGASTSTTTSVISSTAKPSTTTSKPPTSTTSSTKVTTSTSTKTSSTTLVTTITTTSSVKTTTTSSVSPVRTTTTTSSAAPSSTGIKYLITFGDSYSQTGFDPKGTLASASNPLGNPYFPGWTTTGGANWIGYYITQFNSSPIYSYNFAYGGATTDASLVTPYAPTVLSFIDQVNQYLTSTKTIPGFVQWTASNSLFGIWMGVNDVGNSWYLSNYNTLLTQIIAQYINQTQILYNNGARNFLFLGVPPIQLTPNVVAQGSAASGEAAAIAQYNSALSTAVANFAAANAGAKTWIVDTQKPFLTALNNPIAYGAPDATCFDASGTKCLWFNDYHPGQAIQKLVAQAVATAVGNW